LKKRRRRLLVPIALVTAGCGAQRPCGWAAYQYCSPDGSYLCGENCAANRGDDGGVLLWPDGGPICVC
jgi:hypothetical protein